MFAEVETSRRFWWARMLLACALLAAALVALAVLAPIGRLHYVAWRYRRQLESRDPWPTAPNPTSPSDLRQAADMLASRRASPEFVRRLLGPPSYFARTEDGGLIHFYNDQPPWLTMWGSWGSGRFSSSGVVMVFQDGVPARWEECELWISDAPPGSQPAEGDNPWSTGVRLCLVEKGHRLPDWIWEQSGSLDLWELVDYDHPTWVAGAGRDASVPGD
jgi:hypothetical protein